MRLKKFLIAWLLDNVVPSMPLETYWAGRAYLRACLIGVERGQTRSWTDFVDYVQRCEFLRTDLLALFDKWNYLEVEDNATTLYGLGRFYENAALSVAPWVVDTPEGHDMAELIAALLAARCKRSRRCPRQMPVSAPSIHPPALGSRTQKTKSEIMYLEWKPGITGPARIGRVRFSKTGKTIYYQERTFQSLKGRGHLCNFYDVASGEEYWISRCRKDGLDTLYPGIVQIDDDVREEYWRTIRARPDLVRQTSFRSNGKYRR